MDFGLGGKTALVAAASKGLGKAVARALAEEGANVVIFARDEAALRAAEVEIQRVARAGSRAVAVVADVTRAEDLERVVQETFDLFGTIDVLYANTGGPPPKLFDALADDDWQRNFELLLLSVIRLTRLCLPAMRARQWGRIIVGTSSGVKQPIDTLMLSNTLRAGVTAWAKTLSDQVAPQGITVNCLAPGRIETDRVVEIDTDAARRTGQSPEKVRQQKLAAVPMGRYGNPAEFAAAAAFLASEQASYITGVTLSVDGGLFRGTY